MTGNGKLGVYGYICPVCGLTTTSPSGMHRKCSLQWKQKTQNVAATDMETHDAFDHDFGELMPASAQSYHGRVFRDDI